MRFFDRPNRLPWDVKTKSEYFRLAIAFLFVPLLLLGIYLFSGYFPQRIFGQDGIQKHLKYENKFDKYSLEYPSDWVVRRAARTGDLVTLSNFDTDDHFSNTRLEKSKFSVDIVVFDNPEDLTPEKFAKWNDRNNYEGLGVETGVDSQEIKEINGRSGLFREISNVDGSAWEFFFEKSGKIYLVAARQNPNFKAVYDQIVQSLHVTD